MKAIDTNWYSLPLFRALGENWVKTVRESGELSAIHSMLVSSGIDDGEIDNLIGEIDAFERGENAHHAMLDCLRQTKMCGEWAKSAFPLIECTNTLAASLMATTVPPECMPELSSPWETFVIVVPEKTLIAHDMTKENGWEEPQFIDWLIVLHQQPTREELAAYEKDKLCAMIPAWSISMGMRGVGFTPAMKFRSLEEMAKATVSLDVKATDIFGRVREFLPFGRDKGVNVDGVKTTGRLICRYVLGVLLELTSPGIQSQIKADSKKGIRRKREMPMSWNYKLTRSVKVDCREWVRTASSTGEKKLVQVQSLVRGHWKPKLSEKVGRPIHIEPYWRGPEDAPIAVRPHVLKERAS